LISGTWESFKEIAKRFQMKCPFCNHQENKVVDSRTSQSGDITRRRRECLSCGSRYTTYERVEELMPLVVKKDNRREEFDREKVLEGIRIACRKRHFTALDLEDMVREVELKIQALGVREIASREIGDFVMSTLHRRDKVAYIRFASVYREFKDVEDFLTELQKEQMGDGPTALPVS
jgi:transcriptional repressor NrdR